MMVMAKNKATVEMIVAERLVLSQPNLMWRTAARLLLLLPLLITCDRLLGPDHTPPKIIITYPINGSIVSELVTITCVATDDHGIKKVNLWVDGKPIAGAEDQYEPYELIWNTTSYENHSSHTITVRATDTSDNKTDSEPIVLTVDNSASYPTKINIISIKYLNNSFVITWRSCPDLDFLRYTLFESNVENMLDERSVFTTTNRHDTTYVVQNVSENEIRYYRLAVSDSVGLKTFSTIRQASAKESSIPTSGLVAYYPFNGNADDESGNQNHGIVFGTTLTNDRFGNPNSAYYFDGQDDFIAVNESITLEPDDFSIAIWMKTYSLRTYTYQTLIIKEDGWNDGFKVVLRSELKDNLANTILFTVSGSVANNNSMVNLHSQSIIAEKETWYHIAVTYQAGGMMKIFINGRLDISTAGPSSWDKENSYELVIGRHSNNGGTAYGGYFWGVIDDILIYDHALSDQEIELLYSLQRP